MADKKDLILDGFIKRAFKKNAINKERPKTEKLKGAERLYSPFMQEQVPKLGDMSAMAIPLFLIDGKAPFEQSFKRVDDYIKEGKSTEIVNTLNDINKMNKEIMSQTPTVAGQGKLIANTIREVKQPRDTIEDIEMDLKNNPHLTEEEKTQIINNALERFAKNQNPLNNLEATRPDSGTLGHSIDTAFLYGIMLKRYFPEMTGKEIEEAVEAAKLHDYGKGMVRYRDINSKVKFKDNPEIGDIKKTEVNTHTVKGKEALEKMGEKQAAKYAGEHHSYSDSFKDELLKAVDIYNARTGKRVYRETQTPEDALVAIQKYNVGNKPDQISQEAYNALKQAVEEGLIPRPDNFKSDLYDVYATEAGNAIEDRGIQLFDVETAKNYGAYKLADIITKASSAAMAGKGLQALAKKVFGNMDKQAKTEMLMDYFKDKDKVMYDRLRLGYYTKSSSIDKIFQDNVDGIIEMRKNQE